MQDMAATLNVGKIAEHLALAYESILNELRQKASLALTQKLNEELPKNSLEGHGYALAYADVGSGRKIELRYDASHEKSNRESAYTISISADPYDIEAKEITFFLPSLPQFGGHQHPYMREGRDSSWRPSEEVIARIERAIGDFQMGARID